LDLRSLGWKDLVMHNNGLLHPLYVWWTHIYSRSRDALLWDAHLREALL
jgi:hypothetical protein